MTPASGCPAARPPMGALSPDLDVVIPALNEEHRIAPTLEAVLETLASASFSSRVTVVDNGSTDGTVELVRSFGRAAPVRVETCTARGKGAAVRTGVLASTGRRVAFCDADLSTPPSALLAAMTILDEGARVVIGSRRSLGAVIVTPQPRLRRVGGRVFNRAATQLVGPVPDTQCGFKLLDGQLARAVFAEMRLRGYAFDVELLARLMVSGVPVAELPVAWADDPGTRLRPVSDGYRAFRDLLFVRQAVKHSERVSTHA